MLYLYGASGHAKVVIEILEQRSKKIDGLLDNNPAITDLLGYPVSKKAPSSAYKLIITIGNNAIRKKIAESEAAEFETAVHPSANISARSAIGEGTVIMAAVNVNSCTLIGQHVILNTACTIDHDCVIGNFAHISPGAALAGNVQVGEGAHIGIGASVIQGITIGKWATVGAGAVIIHDVPDYAVVVGNPGKIIKYNSSL
jgi:sugar O-acyltransferase (sialic acid O-acetyltransferase NeuD family)